MSVKNFIRCCVVLLLTFNLVPERALSVGFDAFKYGPGPGGGGGNQNPERWRDLNQRRSEADRERDREARALMDSLPATSADIDRQLRETHEHGMRFIEEQHQQRMAQIDREDRQRREHSNRKFQEEMAQFDRARDRLLSLRDRRDQVQEQIRSMDHYETRRDIVDTATGVLRMSRDFVLKDQYEESEWASNITETFLDLATSTLPGVSWGRDVYEAVSGKDLISGEVLSPFSRSMSVAGAVSFGTGSMAKKAGKAFEFFSSIMKSGDRLADKTDTVMQAKRLIESASNITRNGPTNPGVLHQIEMGRETIADTFRSSSYFSYVSTKPITLYRVQGAAHKPGESLGRFWTRDQPTGPIQSIIDSALDQKWGNSGTNWLKLEVPAGSRIFEGAAANQRGLVGGGNQVFLESIPDSWVKTFEQGSFK